MRPERLTRHRPAPAPVVRRWRRVGGLAAWRRSRARQPRAPVVRTTAGRVRGTRRRRPAGVPRHSLWRRHRRRGASCRRPPPAPWRGIVDATDFGAASPQPGSEAEPVRRLPVPQCHGAARRSQRGRGRSSSTSTAARIRAAPDRARCTTAPTLCRRGDVVVVTLNHRLSLFGYPVSARISRIPATRACSTWCWRCTGCATTSRRSAAIRAASPC